MTRAWEDKRRIRRMAALLSHGFESGDRILLSADRLDSISAARDGDADWPAYLEAARHYLRELGRTKS